jgi:hypothetical protein
MSCYTKIKRNLEICGGVKVKKNKENKIIISKDDKILTTYDLKFVEYSKQNLQGFIDYWKYELKIKGDDK